MTYVQCDCGDKAVVDKSKLLMSSPPQYETHCMGCNAISYVRAEVVDAPMPSRAGLLSMLEQALEPLMARVSRLEEKLGVEPEDEV